MRNKKNDIPYLGCREEQIRRASPRLNEDKLNLLYHYVHERHYIKLARDVGRPYPWTDDPILRDYRFTNVRREDDRVSKWIIDHIVKNDNLTQKDRAYRVILARMYNRVDTLELIEVDKDDFSWEDYSRIHHIFDTDPEKGRDYYTRAFKTIGLKNSLRSLFPSIPTPELAFRFCASLFVETQEKYASRPWSTWRADEIFNEFKKYPGVGDFMAYQLFVDMTYLSECPVSENEFVVCGPGCKAGLDMLFEDYDGLTYEEAIFWLRDHQDELFTIFGDSLFRNLFIDKPKDDRKWSVMSIENCFCEFSKYNYIKEGKHRRPRKYLYKEGDGNEHTED